SSRWTPPVASSSSALLCSVLAVPGRIPYRGGQPAARLVDLLRAKGVAIRLPAPCHVDPRFLQQAGQPFRGRRRDEGSGACAREEDGHHGLARSHYLPPWLRPCGRRYIKSPAPA